MESLLSLIFIFLVSIFGGWIGTIAGGSALIMIPALIFLGLPAQIAVGTLKFSSIGLSFGGTYKYSKINKSNFKLLIPLVIITVIGGFLGAKTLLNFNPSQLKIIIGILLLIILPFIIFKKDNLVNKTTSKLKKAFGFIFLFLVMFYGGFFGAGGGTLALYVFLFFFGLNLIESQATVTFLWIFLSIISLIIFSFGGILNYFIGLIIFIGALIGGYLGAHTAINKGNVWIKSILCIVVIISSIKLIFL